MLGEEIDWKDGVGYRGRRVVSSVGRTCTKREILAQIARAGDQKRIPIVMSKMPRSGNTCIC